MTDYLTIVVGGFALAWLGDHSPEPLHDALGWIGFALIVMGLTLAITSALGWPT